MALLCSALAWQRAETVQLLESHRVQQQMDVECSAAQRLDPEPGPEPAPAPEPEPEARALRPPAAAGEGGQPESDSDDDFVEKPFSKPKQGGRRPKRGGAKATLRSRPGKQASGAGAPATAAPCPDAGKKKLKKKPAPAPRAPTIFFGTRTHRQIAQVVSELKRTEYADGRMCVLSSREHT